MKKTIMAMALAAMTIATTGTALAATPGQGNFQDNVPSIETNYAHCGGDTTTGIEANAAAMATAADMAAGTAGTTKVEK